MDLFKKSLPALWLCLLVVLPACESVTKMTTPALPPEQVPKLSVGVLLFDYSPDSVSVTAKASQKQAEQKQAAQGKPAEADKKLTLDNPERVHESIRRAESYYLADLFKQQLHESPYFDDVKVVPAETEFFDLIIATQIIRSNGYDFEIQVTAIDSTQNIWLKREQYETEEIGKAPYATNKNAKGEDVFARDPYAKVFKKVIGDLVDETPRSVEGFTKIKNVTKVRYASDMLPAAFPRRNYISADGSRLNPAQLPSEADPSYERVRQVRANEERAMDIFGTYYSDGRKSVRAPYYYWRRDNREAVKYYQDVNDEIARQKTIAAGGIALDIFIKTDQQRSDSAKAAKAAEQLLRMIDMDDEGRLTLSLENADSEFAQLYRDAVEKEKLTDEMSDKMTALGEAFARHVEPRNIEIGQRTVTLSGKIDEQFLKMRELLRKDYAEKTGLPAPTQAAGGKSSIKPRVEYARNVNKVKK